MAIKHVSFITPNADALIDFYAVLQAVVFKDVYIPEEGLRRVVLQFGEQKLQFFQPDDAVVSKSYSWMEHIAFEVADFDHVYQSFKARGTPFSRDKTLSPSGKRMFFVLDPDGRQLEILEVL